MHMAKTVLGAKDASGRQKMEEIKHEEVDQELFEETAIALWVLRSSITNPSYQDILSFSKKNNLKEAHEYILEQLKKEHAEKLFFDLVNAVKNKGIIDKLDRASDFSRGGAYYEYKGVKVLEDGENIELQFTTDKGAPAVVEYRKPSYDVDPEAGTSYKVPGEFTNEGQEIARYGKDGDVDIDFENEIIDPIENVKKIIDD